MDTKLCRSCGVDKPIDCFRQYYGTQKGRYTYCKECESIESRRKYLTRKTALTESERQDLANIQELYSLRVARGLNPPCRSTTKTIVAARIQHELMKEKDQVN